VESSVSYFIDFMLCGSAGNNRLSDFRPVLTLPIRQAANPHSRRRTANFNIENLPTSSTPNHRQHFLAYDPALTMDHSRDPCPWVILNDFGGAFSMGVRSSFSAFAYVNLTSTDGDQWRNRLSVAQYGMVSRGLGTRQRFVYLSVPLDCMADERMHRANVA
jgi:hypothetical protein